MSFEPRKSLADCLAVHDDKSDQGSSTVVDNAANEVSEVGKMSVECTATVAVLGSA